MVNLKNKSSPCYQTALFIIFLAALPMTPAGNVAASSAVVNDWHEGIAAIPLPESFDLPFSTNFTGVLREKTFMVAAEDKIQPSLEPKPAPSGTLKTGGVSKPQYSTPGQISPPAPRPAPPARQMERHRSPEMMEKSSRSAPMEEAPARSSIDRFGGTVIRGKQEPKD